MKKTEIITRLAPTPSGYLHRGNYYNFLLNWLFARQQGGKVFLRLDDLDSDRVKPEFVEAVFRDLESLGLDWDIGPFGPDDFYRKWSQKHRTDRYVELIRRISEKGFTYVCNCSRKSLAEQGVSGEYPGVCRKKNLVFQQDSTAIRFNRSSFGFDDGDPVILRKEGIPAYHIGSICDDIDFNVSHVFRGNDLKDSTQVQKEIAKSAGMAAYDTIQFYHHELLLDKEGQKLSKSNGNTANDQPGFIITEFAQWAGFQIPTGANLKIQDLLDFPLSII